MEARRHTLFSEQANAEKSDIKEHKAHNFKITETEENFKANEIQKEQSGTLKIEGSSSRSLFLAPEQTATFSEVLKAVQEHIATEYSSLFTDEKSAEERKDELLRFIRNDIESMRLATAEYSQEELVNAIYSEMAEYGFLTKYIFAQGIEEIDINSWKDIEAQYSNGETKKLKESFDSPEHAINVIRRMLHASGIVLDNASPMALGHIAKNIRIAVIKSPIVDEDVGVSASIRIVNPQSMTKEDFVESGTATEEILDFLAQCIRYGISVCVSGATSSGKTTIAGWLLTTIPRHKRIYTIESGSRELSLVREENGKVINSVVHTITRDSEQDRQRIDQTALLDMALRFNPDIVVVGEMRGAEANAAQEAARTGVAVVTTIHANSSEATYRRMVSLCKRAVDMSDQTLMDYVTEAYPIVVFCKQLDSKERRLMEVQECEIGQSGERIYRPLFQYVITENRSEGNKVYITGHHQKINPISDSLAKRFLQNGMPLEKIEALKQNAEKVNQNAEKASRKTEKTSIRAEKAMEKTEKAMENTEEKEGECSE